MFAPCGHQGETVSLPIIRPHLLDIWMERYVQRPTRFSIQCLKENSLSAYLNNSTCIKRPEQATSEVSVKARKRFSLSVCQEGNCSFSETNQIILIVSLEKKRKWRILCMSSIRWVFIQRCFALSSGWPSCKSQIKSQAQDPEAVGPGKNYPSQRKKEQIIKLTLTWC